jgi:hypothetical protein
MARRGVGALVVALTLGGMGAACRRSSPPPPPVVDPTGAPAAATTGDLRPLAPPALARYREAQDFVRSGRLDQAQAALEAAVAAEPEFTEGWYNLGATYSNQAVRDAGRGLDVAALDFVRKGVTAKSRARDLMKADVWFLYDASQREIVRSDVAQALEDVDTVLADPESLLAALRLRARGVRHPAE